MENDQEFHIDFSNGLIHIHTNCPKCQHNVSIIQNNTLNNPYISQRSSSKCRKKIFKGKYDI